MASLLLRTKPLYILYTYSNNVEDKLQLIHVMEVETGTHNTQQSMEGDTSSLAWHCAPSLFS
jgi:hypothetical protein